MILLDTTRHEDAVLCGADCADEPEMALRVEYDPGKPFPANTAHRYVPDYRTPSVTLNGPDGEIQVVGLSAIKQFADAFNHALKLAERTGSADRRAA